MNIRYNENNYRDLVKYFFVSFVPDITKYIKSEFHIIICIKSSNRNFNILYEFIKTHKDKYHTEKTVSATANHSLLQLNLLL